MYFTYLGPGVNRDEDHIIPLVVRIRDRIFTNKNLKDAFDLLKSSATACRCRLPHPLVLLLFFLSPRLCPHLLLLFFFLEPSPYGTEARADIPYVRYEPSLY